MDCVMGFQEAVVSGFANVGHYDTRASRSEYWWFALFSGLCGIEPKGDTVARSGSQNYNRWPSNYYPDGNLRMLCNMGQENEFRSCDFNVFSGESQDSETFHVNRCERDGIRG